MSEEQFYSGGGFTPGYRRRPPALEYSFDFLASQHYTVKRAGITIDHTTVPLNDDDMRVIKGGTVMGKITASGKYGPYDATATDGRQTALGFLLAGDIRVDAGDTTAGLMISGSVLEARVVGLTAAAKTALAPHFLFQ